jgi:hypothetical protein
MRNIQHSTFNAGPPTVAGARSALALNVECWLLNVSPFRNAFTAADQ